MKQMVTAHSGCEGTERDSLESIEKALEFHADAIEIDVRRARNGALRLTHNALTEEEYLAKATLQEAFLRIRETDLLVNCDIKEPAVLYYLLDAAAAAGLSRDRLILTGCTSAEQLVRDPGLNELAQVYVNLEQILKYDYLISKPDFSVKELLLNLDEPAGNVKYQFELTEAMTERVVSYCRLLGVTGLNLPYVLFSDRFAEALRKAGVPASVWTVNDAALAAHIFEAGAVNVTTRSVKDVVNARNSVSERR